MHKTTRHKIITIISLVISLLLIGGVVIIEVKCEQPLQESLENIETLLFCVGSLGFITSLLDIFTTEN